MVKAIVERSTRMRTQFGSEMTPASERSPPPGTAALAKGLTVLNLVADSERPMRFTELKERARLPKPTFVRILRTLVAFNLVSHDLRRGTYSLGHRFLEMSHRVWDQFDMQAAAALELERLSRELGETAAFCKLEGQSAVYLDEHSGNGLNVRVEIGRRVPLHCTAAGKALLAALEPSVSRELLNQLALNPATCRSITDIESLRADLTLARARGYAVSREEHLPGVSSVACAISGREGNPICALVILGPSSRLDQSRIHPAGRELIAAVRRITGHAGSVAISPGPRPRANCTRPEDLGCILPWGAQLGEAPSWHRLEEKLYWVDILHPAVYRFDPVTGVNDTCKTGKLVSAVLVGQSGAIRVASQDGIETLNFDDGSLSPHANPERGMMHNRLNDAKVGPGGEIWVGSMCLDASKPSGCLYRVLPEGSVERKATGLTVANGLDWSPNHRLFYFVDTLAGCIFKFDFEPDTGSLGNKRVFAEIPENEGRPDGLCVDGEGGVWCAIWDGWRVNRYAPDGKLDRTVHLPVPRPTSVAFGDADLGTLYITTARTRLSARTLEEAPLSGGIFSLRPGPSGLPVGEYR